MPRVAIENLKLIEIEDLINLIGKDLEAIRCALADSAYSEQISAVSQDILDYSFLEAALLQNYAETIQKLVKFSSGNIKKLLLAFSKKLEVSNVKTMLRAVKAKIDVDETLKHIVPAGTLDGKRCRAILEEAKSVEDVIAALTEFEYGKILKHALEERGEDLALLEVALDKAVYREILEKIEKLMGVDKKIVKNVLGIELDAVNVKIILKGKELAVSPEIIKDYLMPTDIFNEDILEEAMEAADVESMMERLSIIIDFAHPVYKKIFTQMLKESNAPLARLEAILDKASLEMSLSLLREHSRYYNIGFVLAFLNLKWTEVKNLRCIMKGSERKSPTSQVQKLLTIPNEWQKSQMIHRSS
ncbi:MAG: V-type ATPase subunit [Candidatus Hodarchaeales archaeon]|jgi:vacuolar-type H+-ATPase subunit C/Vma6